MKPLDYNQATKISYFHKGSYFILCSRVEQKDVYIFKNTAQLNSNEKMIHTIIDKQQDGMLNE